MPNSSASPGSFFPNLPGQWSIERTVSTGDAFSGIARFLILGPNRLLLKENGSMSLTNGTRVEAENSWVWEWVSETRINVLFHREPEELYHALDFISSKDGYNASASHRCGPDIYRGIYNIGRDAITVHQSVKGPRKSYRLKSLYRRRD
ncbi:MAG: DUF6314 family protein [Pseudomonadota bacterium]